MSYEIQKLQSALAKATSGETVLVISENAPLVRLAINTVLLLDEFKRIPPHMLKLDITNDLIFFEPKGSLRFFSKEHADWNEDLQRIFSYPAEGCTQVVL